MDLSAPRHLQHAIVVDLGDVYLRQRRLVEAEAKLKDALKLAENNSLPDKYTIDLLDRLGTVRRELGRFEKAKANARSATKRLKAAPQFEEQFRDRVFGNFKKAKMMLKVMQAKESGDAPA